MIARRGRPRPRPARVAMDLYCDHPACERRATASVPDSEFEWILPTGWIRMVLRMSSVDPPVDVDLCHEHAAPFRLALRDMCEWTAECPPPDLPVRKTRGAKKGKKAKATISAMSDANLNPTDLSEELTGGHGQDGTSTMAGQHPVHPLAARMDTKGGLEAALAVC